MIENASKSMEQQPSLTVINHTAKPQKSLVEHQMELEQKAESRRKLLEMQQERVQIMYQQKQVPPPPLFFVNNCYDRT